MHRSRSWNGIGICFQFNRILVHTGFITNTLVIEANEVSRMSFHCAADTFPTVSGTCALLSVELEHLEVRVQYHRSTITPEESTIHVHVERSRDAVPLA